MRHHRRRRHTSTTGSLTWQGPPGSHRRSRRHLCWWRLLTRWCHGSTACVTCRRSLLFQAGDLTFTPSTVDPHLTRSLILGTGSSWRSDRPRPVCVTSLTLPLNAIWANRSRTERTCQFTGVSVRCETNFWICLAVYNPRGNLVVIPLAVCVSVGVSCDCVLLTWDEEATQLSRSTCRNSNTAIFTFLFHLKRLDIYHQKNMFNLANIFS